ncbi:MAG TPA: serine protease [Pseudonocardia sp.]|uniref:serine protease n=1 Tax=Pseudonocardia sp. TaxID=60912 RepID=UPI002B4B5B93|nr:serine protease [Pseudonocardia sp.]HLU55092.1 serine protease [Pseudonocardia sp.]
MALRRAVVLCALVVAAALAAGPAHADPGPAITPGVLLLSPVDGQVTSSCRAGFVFAGHGATYLGYAAHCAGASESMGLSGCAEPTLPVGTGVTIVGNDGSRTSGRLAYTSWGTMQRRGESDPARCLHNDFALVELDPADAARADPTVPVFGGPTGLDTDGTDPGEPVYSHQPRGGANAAKEGRSLGSTGRGLAHRVETRPPGRSGDSGSGYLDGRGRAFGVLSTLYTDGSGANGVTDLARALAYANAHGGIGHVVLVPGREPFRLRD